jgi:hypothetical protein
MPYGDQEESVELMPCPAPTIVMKIKTLIREERVEKMPCPTMMMKMKKLIRCMLLIVSVMTTK